MVFITISKRMAYISLQIEDHVLEYTHSSSQVLKCNKLFHIIKARGNDDMNNYFKGQ